MNFLLKSSKIHHWIFLLWQKSIGFLDFQKPTGFLDYWIFIPRTQSGSLIWHRIYSNTQYYVFEINQSVDNGITSILGHQVPIVLSLLSTCTTSHISLSYRFVDLTYLTTLFDKQNWSKWKISLQISTRSQDSVSNSNIRIIGKHKSGRIFNT